MSRHTSGPWEILPYSGGQAPIVWTDHKDGWTWDIAHVAMEPGDGTQEANARLIAAAPDLLAALQAAVECRMVPISSALEGGANKHSRQVHVADQIRAAITKATGWGGV